jgi:hypothetical protein
MTMSENVTSFPNILLPAAALKAYAPIGIKFALRTQSDIASSPKSAKHCMQFLLKRKRDCSSVYLPFRFTNITARQSPPPIVSAELEA